jgi:hypothetical protein
MTTSTPTAAEVVQAQHLAILNAIALLQADLDAMTGDVSPSTANWQDVCKYARAADIAKSVIERYEES